MTFMTQKTLQKSTLKIQIIEREIFEKYNSLSEDELNTKSNKIVYVKNDVMTTVIRRFTGEK